MKKFQKIPAVLLLVLVLCFGVCSAATEVKLAPYLSVHFSGSNGSGVARAGFDLAGFEYEIMSAWKDEDRLEKLSDLAAVEKTITLEPAVLENLSNGDTFTVRICVDSELAKEKGYSFIDPERSFTVQGLTDTVQIDPFSEEIFGEDKMVAVFAEGVDPFLMLQLWNNASFGDPVGHIRYRADKDFNFRNNEEITVTAELDASYAKQGYALSRTETTLSFDGFDRYVSTAEDLTEEVLMRISDRAYQESVNGGVVNIMDGVNSFSPWAVEFTDIRVGEKALLAVNNNIEMEYSFLLVPVYKTIATDEWYDMDTGVNTSVSWENVVGYYKFTDLIVHSDGAVSFNEAYVEMNGNYTSDDVAGLLYLDAYRSAYRFTEVPMPHAEPAE